MTSPKILGLFPTPLMLIESFLSKREIEAYLERAASLETHTNTGTGLLAHTEMMQPQGDPLWTDLLKKLDTHLVQFGNAIFGESLDWRVKEIWLNVLDPGGSQFMHTHANSFISGILYVTPPAESTPTAFRKPSGGTEFIFKNDIPAGHPNSDTWVLPEVPEGTLALYPSYLLHGVPPNDGARRITIAFNAIPDHLDSLGYRIEFK